MKFIVFIFNDEGKRSPSFLLSIPLCRLSRNLGFSDLFPSVVKALVGARHLLREPGTRGRWRHALLLLCLNSYFRKNRNKTLINKFLKEGCATTLPSPFPPALICSPIKLGPPNSYGSFLHIAFTLLPPSAFQNWCFTFFHGIWNLSPTPDQICPPQ